MAGKCRSCCVPFCLNRRNLVRKPRTFYRFPKNEKLRAQWITKIRRDIGPDFKITDATKVCSEHFCKRDFKKLLHSKKKLLIETAVPSIFSWNKEKELLKRKLSLNRQKQRNARGGKNLTAGKIILTDTVAKETTHDGGILHIDHILTPVSPEASTFMPGGDHIEEEICIPHDMRAVDGVCCEGNAEMDVPEHIYSDHGCDDTGIEAYEVSYFLEKQSEAENAKMSNKVLIFKIAKGDTLMRRFTGLPNVKGAEALLTYLQTKAGRLTFCKGKCTPSKVHKLNSKWGPKLKIADQFLLALMRLKCNKSFLELSVLFNVSQPTVSRVFTTWVNFMYHEFKLMFPFPDAGVIRAVSKTLFGMEIDTTIIIGCSEIRIPVPFQLTHERNTFSSYKRYARLKFLVGITPTGLVCFISQLFDGSTSDREITKDCGILDLLRDTNHTVMADKGFQIEDILPEGVKLLVPPRSKKSAAKQISAGLHMHLERVIDRIKSLRCLGGINGCLPLTHCGIANQLVNVCGFITNFHSGY